MAAKDTSKDADVASQLTRRDMDEIRATYRIPREVRLAAPESHQRVNHEESRRLAVHEEPLKIGIAFPFTGLVADFLRVFGITPGQMTPNSWRIIRELELWARRVKVQLTGRCLLGLLSMKKSGAFIAVQGAGNSKVVSGMPSSNKNWKPRFFFAWRIGEDGAPRHWDVPLRWREDCTLPEPPSLSGKEARALEVLKATLKDGPLPYTPPSEARGERMAGEKRPMEAAEEPVTEVLEAIPLAAVPPGRAEPSQIGGRRKIRLAKKARVEESPSAEEIRAAEEESVRTFEAEQAVLAREEAELQAALRASVSEKAPAHAEGGAPAREEEELQLAIRASTEEGMQVFTVSPDSSGVEAHEAEAEARAPGRTLAAEAGTATAQVEAVTAGTGEVLSRAEEAETVRVAPSPAETVGATDPSTEAVLGPLSETEAEVTRGTQQPPQRAGEAGVAGVTEDAARPAAGPSRSVESSPSGVFGPPGSPPERVRRARLKPVTVPPVPRPRFVASSSKAFRARVRRLMLEHAAGGNATSRSPVDLPSVASDRADSVARRMKLVGELGSFGQTLCGPTGRGPASTARDTFIPKEKATPEQLLELRQIAKEPQLPVNHIPERRLGGPKGPEVQPEDVDYDLHALSRLSHLAERDGRPLLPGSSSFSPEDPESSSEQLAAKCQADMLSVWTAYLALAREREAAREAGIREKSYQEGVLAGQAAAEKTDFERVHRLETEVARLRTRAFEADTLADKMRRERDAQAHCAAKAEAQAAEQKQANERLVQSALQEARAEVQGQVEALRRRALEAEKSAQEAEIARARVSEDAAHLGGRLEEAEASAQEGWNAARKRQEEAEALQQDISQLHDRVFQLERDLAESESMLGAMKDDQLAEQTRTQAAEAKLSEALSRAEAADAAATVAREELSKALQRAEVAEANAVAAEAMPSGTPKRPEAPAAAVEATLSESQGRAETAGADAVPGVSESPVDVAALMLRIGELQRESDELRHALEVLEASSEAQAREAEIREVRRSAEMYNAALEDACEEYPGLDLSGLFIPLSGPPPSPGPGP